ncbi:MAG: alpha/beta fold hydrolase [Lachnotalea sp.]
MEKTILQLNEMLGDIEAISDDQFQEVMKFEVEPFLDSIRKTGFFSRESNKNLYYEEYLSLEATQNIVICHGFAENTEKYKEMIYYFYRENCNVFIMDHQGHGNSFRMVEDYSVTHVELFDDYVEDLKAFMSKKVKPDSQQLPIILYTHSMGGAIGGSYLEKYPNDFSKAIFSSPMFEINTGNMPLWVTKLIADFNVMIGHKKDHIYVQEKFNPKERLEDSCSSSNVRYSYYFQKRLNNEHYQNNCGTYSWLKQSILATKELLKIEKLQKINIPIIIFQAENDSLVKANSQNLFAQGVKDAQIVFVPISQHEIYMARSKIITPFLNKLFEFIR